MDRPRPPSLSVHTLALLSPPVEHLYTVPVQGLLVHCVQDECLWCPEERPFQTTIPGSQRDLRKGSKVLQWSKVVVLLARWVRPCCSSSLGRYSTPCWTQCRSFQILKKKSELLSEFEPTTLREGSRQVSRCHSMGATRVLQPVGK